MVVGGSVQTKKQCGPVLNGGERTAGWWCGWGAESEMRLEIHGGGSTGPENVGRYTL